MANIRQLASGHWQVQIRLKGRKATETFLRYDHAREWASAAEAQVDKGRAPTVRRARKAKTFGALIDLHIEDMKDVGKPPQRSKSAT
ncbi:MAG: site-specific integrase, partial [Pseudomonadota bacterium]|nr:site-specific integrase [Pseudomonadota bacterium]